MEQASFPNDTIETRRVQAQQLGAIARSGLAVESRFDASLEPSEGPARECAIEGDPYALLAVKLVEDFIVQAEQTGDATLVNMACEPSVRQGCRGIASILHFAPAAYRRLVGKEGRSLDMDEFVHALRMSSDVTKLFAATDRVRSAIRQIDFGVDVLGGSSPLYEEVPFLFRRHEGGELYYEASMVTLSRADHLIATMEQSGALPDFETFRRCPAIGVVMDAQWQQAITLCVESPTLFPADLRNGPEYMH